jgi:hypothetical protein
MKIMHAMYSQHNSSKKPEIRQICEDCAEKRGLQIPEGHIASFWTDTCDVCGEIKELTDIYDFSKIKTKNKENENL